MDNIASLMAKQQYELVIKLTANTKDIHSLFYRVTAFMALGKIDSALDVINKNKAILEKRLDILVKMHIELLVLKQRFDDAFDVLNYYTQLPYQNQKTEEILREMPKYIREEEKNYYSFKEKGIDYLTNCLTSKDDEDVLAGLDALREKDITIYLGFIKSILVNFPKQHIRSFALLLLVDKDYAQEVEYLSSNGLIQVVPHSLKKPFVGDEFSAFVAGMSKKCKDPTLAKNALQLLSTYILYVYPENVSLDETLSNAVVSLSKDYLRTVNDLPLTEEEFDLKQKIKAAIEDC